MFVVNVMYKREVKDIHARLTTRFLPPTFEIIDARWNHAGNHDCLL